MNGRELEASEELAGELRNGAGQVRDQNRPRIQQPIDGGIMTRAAAHLGKDGGGDTNAAARLVPEAPPLPRIEELDITQDVGTNVWNLAIGSRPPRSRWC